MELFSDFGFEPVFFTAQIINFLILAFIFQKFLYKPILKALKDRQETIKKGLDDAEKATIALDEASAQKDEILRKATLEAEKIIEETKKSAEELREELTSKSKAEADRIISEAKTTAAAELLKAKDEARGVALDLARSILDRVLDEVFTKQEKQKILEKNIKKINIHE